MTVIVKIGRRVPRKWMRRTAYKTKGLLTFQENIWLIIARSMTLAKKKATEHPGELKFEKKNYREPEDMNYDIEWIDIKIEGNPNQEEEEYNEAMQMYKSLKQVFKKEFKPDKKMLEPFKTKNISAGHLSKVYKKGYGSAGNNTIAQKLLELGIITYIEKIDYEPPELLNEGEYIKDDSIRSGKIKDLVKEINKTKKEEERKRKKKERINKWRAKRDK